MRCLIYCLGFLLIFASCKEFKEAECTGVKGFKVNSISMSGMDAEIILGIKNPNSIGFSIYPSEFDIALSNIGLGKARLKKRVHINPNTEKNYTFKMKSSFKDMNMLDIMKLINSGGLSGTIQVKGNLKAGKFYLKKNFPVNIKESLK
ncbi:MAG: LEA type 2 family protein [Sphingobacteriales bacterium]